MKWTVLFAVMAALTATGASAATKIFYESQTYSEVSYALGAGAMDGTSFPFRGSYTKSMSIRFEMEISAPLMMNTTYFSGAGPNMVDVLSVSDGIHQMNWADVGFRTDASGDIVEWAMFAQASDADTHTLAASSADFDSVLYHNVQGMRPNPIQIQQGIFSICCTFEESSAETAGLGTWTVVHEPVTVPLSASGGFYVAALLGGAVWRRRRMQRG